MFPNKFPLLMSVQWVTLTFAERKRRLLSLSGFGNVNTKSTNQREFRLSLIFLLRENNRQFRSAIS